MNKSNLGVLTSIILLSGFFGIITFEDADAKKAREIVVVGSKVKDVVKNTKLSSCDIDFLDADGTSILRTSVEDKGGKVKTDVPDGAIVAEIQCILKDGTASELLSIELDDEDKKQRIRVQSGSGTDTRIDSFFDVFYDVYTVDSFFDIFTELQNSAATSDSFFDIFYDADAGATQPDSFFDIFTNPDEGFVPDSFFDVFTEIDARDRHFDTEIISMDLRGQSCDIGDVVTGFVTGSDGTVQIQCSPDQQGGLGDIQVQIDEKNSEISAIESQISVKELDLASLQIQLDELALPSQQILQCQQQCASLERLNQIKLIQCAQEAQTLGLVFEEHCSAQITAANTPCTCPTTSDPILAEQLVQQIALINDELVVLNSELEKCNFELMVLETLQNQFG